MSVRKAQAKQPSVRDFVNQLDIVAPLNLRDAFWGDRTNAIKLHQQTEADDDIECYDYTSLYPWVNKNEEYPKGHHEIIFQPGHTKISHYLDIARFKVPSSYNPYHPVLPLSQNDKLTYPVCRTCVEEEMNKPMLEQGRVCPHTPQHRQILGT